MGKTAEHAISTAITLEGASDYKRDVDAIRARVKALNSEYKLLSAQWGENEKTIEALTEKQRIYQSLVDSLNKQLTLMRNRSDEFAKTQQENVSRQEELTKKTSSYSSILGIAEKNLEGAKEKQAQAAAEVEKWNKKIDEATDGGKKHNNILNLWKKDIEASADELYKANEKVDKYTLLIEHLTKAHEADKSELAALPEVYKENEAIIERHNDLIFKAEKELLGYKQTLAITSDELEAVKNGEEVLTEAQKEAAEAAAKAAEQQRKEQEALDAIAAEFVNKHIVEDFNKLVDALKQCVEASREFESQLARVQKTTDFSDREMEEFAKGIKELAVSIPITTKELTDIAEQAGQLGVASGDILDFTETIAMFGKSTNMSATSAAQSLAQIASITGLTSNEYENLASTIVALGNNYATTESNITQFMQRIAGSASNVGMTEAQMAGLATAVSSVGMQADAGGTAIQSLINKMQSAVETGDNLDAWAKVMGIDTETLTKLWGDNATDALLLFVQGLGKLDDGMVSTLKSLGVGEQRLIRTVTNLANAEEKTQLLSRALETADNAWRDNNALIIEANRQFETSESTAIKLENALGNLKIAIGDNLRPAVDAVTKGATSVVTVVTTIVEKVPFLTDAIVALTGAMGIFAAKYVASTGALSKFVEYIKTASSGVMSVIDPVTAATAAVVALGTVLYALASRTENAGTEAKKLVSNMKKIREEAEESIEVVDQQNDSDLALVSTLRLLNEKEEKSATDKAMMVSLVNQLNEVMPELNLAYNEEADALWDIATNAEISSNSLKEMAEALAKQRLEEEKIEALTELYVNKIQIEDELKNKQNELTVAEKEWTDALINNSENAEELEAKVNVLRYAVEVLKGELDLTTEAIDGNGGYTESTEEATEAVDEHQQAVDELNAKQQALQKEFETTAQAAYENLRKEVSGAFDYVGEASKSSYRTVIDNLESQQSYYQNYADNLTNLNHRNIDGMSEMLKEMQNEGKLTADVCASMADMSDEELAQVIAAWNNVKEAQKATADGLSDASNQYTKKAAEYKQALLDLEGEYNVYVDTVYRQYGSSSDPWIRHAQGLEYVPYDDYAALLHEGEMVLTKAEARAYRESHTRGQSVTNNNNMNRNYGGVTLNVYAGANQDVDALADEIMYRIDDATKRKEAVWA